MVPEKTAGLPAQRWKKYPYLAPWRKRAREARESFPGFYCTGNFYRPAETTFPGHLGRERGRFSKMIQARCARPQLLISVGTGFIQKNPQVESPEDEKGTGEAPKDEEVNDSKTYNPCHSRMREIRRKYGKTHSKFPLKTSRETPGS